MLAAERIERNIQTTSHLLSTRPPPAIPPLQPTGPHMQRIPDRWLSTPLFVFELFRELFFLLNLPRSMYFIAIIISPHQCVEKSRFTGNVTSSRKHFSLFPPPILCTQATAPPAVLHTNRHANRKFSGTIAIATQPGMVGAGGWMGGHQEKMLGGHKNHSCVYWKLLQTRSGQGCKCTTEKRQRGRLEKRSKASS